MFDKKTEGTPKELYQKGVQLLSQGQLDAGRGLLLDAAEDEVRDHDLLYDIGWAFEKANLLQEAIKAYSRAVLVNPDFYHAHARLGQLLMEFQGYQRAISHFEKANEIKPGDPGILNNLGLAYKCEHRFEDAKKAFHDALEAGGPEDLIVGTLAGLYEETNQLDDLKETLYSALEKFPNDDYLNFVAAKLERREGNPETALKRLKPFLEAEAEIDALTVYHFEMGRIYDALEKYEEAYDYFQKGNELAGQEPIYQGLNKKHSREVLQKVGELDLKELNEKVSSLPDPETGSPVFLVGFPRSGTTLLNQILDGHPELDVIEEQPTLLHVEEFLIHQKVPFPDGFLKASEEQLQSCRETYAEGVERYGGVEDLGRVVDKFPLQIIQVPLIHFLFPKAKIIFALRHPCDVCMSCFMQNFGLNNAMINFANLDDTTSYYQGVMELWDRTRKILPLDIHTVRYENLLDDLEKEAREIISFLGLDWNPEVLEYQKQAQKKKFINTPSYHQVIKPIYKDSKNRWKNYEKFLSPYKSRLKHLCENFGYDF